MDYTVKVMNRFKGLDLMPEELWNGDSQHCTGGSDQNHLKEKEKQEGKAGLYTPPNFSWTASLSE